MEIGRAQFYEEEAFRRFLEVDEKRSIRSGRLFLLLLVEAQARSGLERSDKIFDVLQGTLRETDYVGWYRTGLVAAAVLAHTGEYSTSDVCAAVRKRTFAALNADSEERERPFNVDVRPLIAERPDSTGLRSS